MTQVLEVALRRCEHHESGYQPKLMKVKRGFFSTNFNWTFNQFQVQPETFPAYTQENEVICHVISETTQGWLTWGFSLVASLLRTSGNIPVWGAWKMGVLVGFLLLSQKKKWPMQCHRQEDVQNMETTCKIRAGKVVQWLANPGMSSLLWGNFQLPRTDCSDS